MMGILAFVVLNAVPTICWTVAAIHFDKWWLLFFAVLFRFDRLRYKSDYQPPDSKDDCADGAVEALKGGEQE